MAHAILKLTFAVGMKILVAMILNGVVQWAEKQPLPCNGGCGVSLRSLVKPFEFEYAKIICYSSFHYAHCKHKHLKTILRVENLGNATILQYCCVNAG